jgi:hypothetical protein
VVPVDEVLPKENECLDLAHLFTDSTKAPSILDNLSM